MTLDELDAIGYPVSLTNGTAAGLAASRLVELRPERDGRFRLFPCGRVGAVRIGDLQVQITPKGKVGLARLLFLLGYAADPGWRADDVDAADERDLWPALAESLARQAERALRHGVLQGYQTRDDALRTVRGRIRIGDQISMRPGMMFPLEVTYDEYTHDILENQILRTAVRRMLSVPGLAVSARTKLAHVDSRLDGVTVLRPGLRPPAWQRTRMNTRYHQVLRLSEVILRNSSTEPGTGGLQMAAFVVRMWKVYEDFLSTALTESLRRYPGYTKSQYPERLDRPSAAPGRVPMAVDLVHLVHGIPRLIFDAKYKVASSDGRYPNADHYQMLAYCTALGVRRAWLVYAQGGSPVERHIVNTDILVVEYPLDLAAEPSVLLQQIDALAQAAWIGTQGASFAPPTTVGPLVRVEAVSAKSPPAEANDSAEWLTLIRHAVSDWERELLRALALHDLPLPEQGFETDLGVPFDLAWPTLRIVVGMPDQAQPTGWELVPPDPAAVIAALSRALSRTEAV